MIQAIYKMTLPDPEFFEREYSVHVDLDAIVAVVDVVDSYDPASRYDSETVEFAIILALRDKPMKFVSYPHSKESQAKLREAHAKLLSAWADRKKETEVSTAQASNS